ncbi:MAG: hypothetical protein ACYDBB_01270 [Armatimonadota bacterium]
MNPLFIAAIRAARRAAEARHQDARVSPPTQGIPQRRVPHERHPATRRPAWWERLVRWLFHYRGKRL